MLQSNRELLGVVEGSLDALGGYRIIISLRKVLGRQVASRVASVFLQPHVVRGFDKVCIGSEL